MTFGHVQFNFLFLMKVGDREMRGRERVGREDCREGAEHTAQSTYASHTASCIFFDHRSACGCRGDVTQKAF